MKRSLSVILAVVLCIGVFSPAVPGAIIKANAVIDHNCGEATVWDLDTQTGALKISGTGNTYDYPEYGSLPFIDFKNSITSVVFEEGITGIGDGFLNYLINCTYISFPSTLVYIGNNILPGSVSEINITDNNDLRYFNDYFSVTNTYWFKSQPQGVVYLGRCVIGFNGTINEDETVVLREDTISIAPSAFYNQTSLKSLTYPDNIEYVGYRALESTAFLSAQPVGALYIGKALYKYIGDIVTDDIDYVVLDGTTTVSSRAFYNREIIKTITLPKSVEVIGSYAFFNSSLKNIYFAANSDLKYIGKRSFAATRLDSPDLPEGLLFIDDLAFNEYSSTPLKIPASVIKIGKLSATSTNSGDMRTIFEVSPDNEYYSSDEFGVLFNKDKSELIRSSIGTNGVYTLPDTVTNVAPGAFRYLNQPNTIILPDDLKSIGDEAFAGWCYQKNSVGYNLDFGESEPEIGHDVFRNDRFLTSVTVRSMDLVFPEGAFDDVDSETFTVYLMRGSKMQTYCEDNGIKYTFLDNVLQLGEITDMISAARQLDRTLYTAESLDALDKAIAAVKLESNDLTQAQVDEWTQAIAAALLSLEYLPADFTAVSEALQTAKAVDRSLYTADSLLLLDSLVLSVDYNANITQQATIDALAADIISSVASLVYREADYSTVTAAVAGALAVNRDKYTRQSLANLDTALQNIEFGLDITQQNRVNAFADSIWLMISALVAKAADYSDVEEAVNRANSIDRGLYTDKSLAILDGAVDRVDYSLTYDDQATVAEYAAAINNALDSLEYLPADYTAVDEAITRAEQIDHILWTNASLIALEQSINSVDRTLNITRQIEVDAYASMIISKIDALEYAPVILRNDPHGIIVKATAKEIYPTTDLTVDKLDPSDISNADFAVGGKVKTALFYDISLLRNSINVQPDGTVTVKIRIPDGVAPEQCKVYHVTDDPVDPLVKYASTLDGDYIVFETDHFSEFAVLEIETVPQGIIITSPPTKTDYVKGEAFDPSGLIVTAFYSNGTNAEITDYDISVDTNTVGPIPLTVYYTYNSVTKSASTIITVSESATEPTDISDIILRIPDNTSVAYRTRVTAVVSADNLPDYCSIVVSEGNETIAIGRGKVKFYIGEMTRSKTVTVSIVDKNNNIVLDPAGHPVTAQFIISVNNGFFARILAFFRLLFAYSKNELLLGK